MGYYISFFGIKKTEILNTFNSKDEEIIKKVEQNEYFKLYNGQDYTEFTTRNALSDIINGNEFNEGYSHTYGYALVSLCATLGQKLPYEPSINCAYDTDYINEYLAEHFNIDFFDIEYFLFSDDRLNSFPIPSIKNFPMISAIELQDLKQIIPNLSNIIITDAQIEELKNNDHGDDEERGYAYEHLKGIIANINYCIDNELDLFSYCH